MNAEWILAMYDENGWRVVTHLQEVEAILNGGAWMEIWCCGPVPPEIVELCHVRVTVKCGRVLLMKHNVPL
jgi:hypothetical protein